MTDKDIQKIAEAVVDLIIKKQKLHDEEFKKDLENMLEGQDDITLGSMSEADLIEEEIYKLYKKNKEERCIFEEREIKIIIERILTKIDIDIEIKQLTDKC